jgi:dynein heavy chain 1
MAITESGLKDQMLSLAVSIEKSELESERVQLIEQSAKDESTLVKLENDILKALAEADPDTILDFDDIIDQLSNTKNEARNIQERQKEAAEKQEQIKIERDKYVELSQKCSIMFFGLSEMLNIDHM